MKGFILSRKELALMYGISRKTLYNWLTKIGFNAKYSRLTPLEVRYIYDRLGEP